MGTFHSNALTLVLHVLYSDGELFSDLDMIFKILGQLQ